MAFSMMKISLQRCYSNYCGHYNIKKSISILQCKNKLLRTKTISTNIYRFGSEENKGWVSIIFEKSDGTQLKRLGKIGDKVQQVIGKDNPDFPGYGECDGTLSCSCCHVILSKEDYDKFDDDKRMKTKEEDLILSATINPTPTSRLGCCLTIQPEMDGIILKLPPEIKDLKIDY
ncbi:unnamed protein product [Larinioides sclopetarius]|uniref:Ferredoxin n=1 Tax=Larinioides sclopetarius TaxID=280406 RepID=A0AAV2AHL8_9ARAC